MTANQPGFERFAAIFETRRSGESESHPIDPRAQAMELRDRFRRAGIKAPLEPGMLCIEKPGMTVLRSARVIIFWRWLDPDIDQDAVIIDRSATQKSVSCTDCLIGVLDHGGDLSMLDFESWRLEPCDAAFPEDDS